MRPISSRHNPLVADCRELAAHPDPHGARVFLDGAHLVREAMAAGVQFDAAIVAASKMTERSEEALLAHELESRGVDVATADERVFAAVSPTRQPSGIAAIGRRRSSTPTDLDAGPSALVVVAAEIQDPGNLGGIIRAVEAGGATAVVVTAGSANPYSWKALRGSMGSALRLPVITGVDLDGAFTMLDGLAYESCAAVARSGTDPDQLDWRGRRAVWIGSEGQGLPTHIVRRCPHRITIPMQAPVESLNAAVAAGVLVYAGSQAPVMSEGRLFDDPPDDDHAGGKAGKEPAAGTPLAERMRPRTLDDIVGQDAILAPGAPLRLAIERDVLQSILLWGPPGTGKTTLARVIADLTHATFVPFSAVLSGIKEIREVMAAAEDRRRRTKRRTIVFVDEIHRFNKAQQDAFLPRVEAGDIILIGATTENPSFEVNAALLSRSKVFVLQPLSLDAVATILSRAVSDRERGLGYDLAAGPDVLAAIARFANGDARSALNLLEFAAGTAPMDPETCVRQLDLPQLEKSIQRRALLYDKTGEEHYNIISALHKSMRNSDPDAAVYWVSRMLEAGEDPLYVARRLVRFASEDIGNADPQALVVAVAAKEAAHFMGMPEGNTALAQAAIYLATAPKSNAVYTAYNDAAADAQTQLAEPVPLHLRNAPTKLMKQLDYGKGYQYAHDDPDGTADMDCLPGSLAGKKYYHPTERGFEKEIKRRIDGWAEIKRKRRSSHSDK